jgi:RHS repeat-associated protein
MIPVSLVYPYRDANQRTRRVEPDSSCWRYEYDSLGQVKSGKRFWSDMTPVAGQQFQYTFDDIGNRTQTQAGGDSTGANLRSANYSANNLNQYSSRDVPGFVDVMGIGLATNAVTVNGQTAYRKAEYFRQQLAVTNSTTALWTNLTVAETGQTSVSGNVYVPKTAENFSYDANGNLTNDGRWSYTWDAENRLTNLTSLSSAPTASKFKLDFAYDWQGRRIQKLVSTNNGSAYVAQYTNRFLYDGWNLVAEINPASSLLRSYVWGSDLSGTVQGAGGVGGLLEITDTANGAQFPAFDGNGNVAILGKASDGTVSARYDYGPFGELLRATGPMAKANPFRFSTKYQDDESDLLCYGYRYCSPSIGRWISRDPIGEQGGPNLHSSRNSLVNEVDPLGLKCACCECAVAIDIHNGGYFPPPLNGSWPPGWDFGVYIYMEYQPDKQGGSAQYRWEEKTHQPVKEILQAGGKPDVWYDYFQLIPKSVPDTWKNRDQTCIPPVGRIVRDYDHVMRPTQLGTWTIQFRLTVVNPKNCGCSVPQVQVTAVVTLDPNSPTGGSFEQPDPGQ